MTYHPELFDLPEDPRQAIADMFEPLVREMQDGLQDIANELARLRRQMEG